MRHVIFVLYEEAIALGYDLLIPRLVPMDPFSLTERYHGGNVVLPEDFGITRTLAIAKIKLIDDLGDWWVRRGNRAAGGKAAM